MNKLSSMIAIFLIALIFNGCANMQGKWEKAEKEDTIGAYNYFLYNENPNAEYKNKAETRIRELKEAQKEKEEASAFESARDAQASKYDETRPESSLEYFISNYPSGKHAPEARKLLESRVYNRIIKKNEMYEYSKFLYRFPNSDLVPDVTARLRKARFEDARKSGSLKDYEDFIKLYPQGQDTMELENDLPKIRLEKRKFEQAMELGEVALRMAPIITVPTKRMPDGLTMQTIGMAKVGPPHDLKYQMARFRKLLEAGADPNLIRIDGFYPAHINGPGSFGPGNPGTVVPSPSKNDGNTLVDYFRIINLKEASELLKKHGYIK